MPAKLTIAFIESIPMAYTYKLAKSLKMQGHKTILFSVLKSDKTSYKSAYSHIISLDLNSFSITKANALSLLKNSLRILTKINSLSKLKPDVIIGVASPRPLWLPALCCKIMHLFSKTPFIFFPYDVNLLRYNDKKFFQKAGIPPFEMKAEHYLFTHADGVFFKGDEYGAVKKIIPLKVPIGRMFPYAMGEYIVPFSSSKLSKKDKEIHVVFLGFLVLKPTGKNALGFLPGIDILKGFADNKVHIHLYSSQYDSWIKENVLEDLKNNSYIHFHKPLGQHEIISEISKYDYGLCTSQFDYNIINKEFAALGPGNKTANYLEAGIPCLFGPCSFAEDHECTRAELRKYNLDLAFTDKEFPFLKKKLKSYNYKKLIKQVALAREEFRMERHINEFESFLREAIAVKTHKSIL